MSNKSKKGKWVYIRNIIPKKNQVHYYAAFLLKKRKRIVKDDWVVFLRIIYEKPVIFKSFKSLEAANKWLDNMEQTYSKNEQDKKDKPITLTRLSQKEYEKLYKSCNSLSTNKGI